LYEAVERKGSWIQKKLNWLDGRQHLAERQVEEK
jgi:hypothetical protein